MDQIYSIVKRVRKDKGITQQQMGEKMHLVPSAYGKLESGYSRITIERLREISELLDTPLSYFLSSDTEGFPED